MEDITQMLEQMEAGQAGPEDLLSAVYSELRSMAAGRMAAESDGHTLQATALVHEAWLRLVDSNRRGWENRAHFFGAAGEAMRRILVDHARKKNSAKRGGGKKPTEYSDESTIALNVPTEELLTVHEALDSLALEDPKAAELVKLRYFVGMTMDEAAEALGMKKRTAEALWTYAKIQLKNAIRGAHDS